MASIVDLLQAHETTVWTVLAIALLVGLPAYRAWLRQRNITAARKAALAGKDEKRCDRAERIVKMMLDAETRRRRWYHLGRDRPQGRHRA